MKSYIIMTNNYLDEDQYVEYSQYEDCQERPVPPRPPRLRPVTQSTQSAPIKISIWRRLWERLRDAYDDTKNLLILLASAAMLLATGILASIYPETLKVTTMIVFGAIIITALCLVIIALPHIFELIAMLIGKGFILLIFIVLLIFLTPLIEKGTMKLIEMLNGFFS